MTDLSLLAAAREAPERPALVASGEEVSFARLAGWVRAAIGWMGARGIGPGSDAEVALVGMGSVEACVALYALVELGVPAVMIDPRSSAGERRRLAAGAALMIEPRRLAQELGHDADVTLPGEVDPERPLAIVQTSGSSGAPRGVVLSRRAFLAAARASARNLGWRDDDRWLLSLPIAHVGGLSILTRCLVGRRAVVVEPMARFDAAAAARVIEKRRATLVSLVPTMLRRLLDLEDWRPPARLRGMLTGGAACPPALLERAAERRWPVLTTYGLTEACSQVATQPYGTTNRGELGCGPPVEGTEVRIAEDGVIEIRGPSLLSAYRPPGEVPLFLPGGWFRTGDLGRVDAAGRLHVLGRADDVVVSGGENVSPLAVERVLKEHPAIAAACVFGVPDAEWGEAVAAALVAREPPADGELRAFLRARLAPWERPRRVAYLNALPARPSGKLDRRHAARLAAPRLRELS